MYLLVALALLGSLVTGFRSFEAPIDPGVPRTSLHFTTSSFPRIDGSTSTKPLRKLIACRSIGVSCGWHTQHTKDGVEHDIFPNVLFDDESDDFARQPTEEQVREAFIVDLPNSKTHEAYVALIEGETDLLLIARPPSVDEEALAQARRVELEAQPVALDAFVFLANAASPVSELSSAQIRDIYRGKVTSWKDVGVDLSPEAARRVYAEVYGSASLEDAWIADRLKAADDIHAYTREQNSGSQELMEQLVMGGEATIAGRELMVVGMGGTFNELDDDPSGLGYTVWYYQQNILKNDRVKLLAVDGVYPTVDTITDRSYPYVAEVLLVMRADEPTGSPARLLAEFLLTAEGQSLIAENGFAPVVRRTVE